MRSRTPRRPSPLRGARCGHSDVSRAARDLLEEAAALLARAEAETGSLAAITSGAG